jgi:hypothetical protein
LAAELGDEIAQGAVGQAEATSHVGQWLTVHEDGPQDFIAALQGLVGFEKELSAAWVVHEQASELSLHYLAKGPKKW